MEVLIKAEGITKYYGERKVLDNVSFSIKKGEIFGLLGPNGAGKTTLIRIIAEGISHKGRILLNGKSIEKRRYSIGYCPQDEMIYKNLNSYDNLKFYAQLQKVKKERVKELMKEFSIPNKKVKHLSGGFRKRLSIAISLLGNPDILIFDEPTVGLDVETRHEVWSIIEKLKSRNKGILLSTHYMEEAENLCDRIAIINEGRIIDTGTVEDLKKKSGINSAIEVKGNFKNLPENFIREDSSLVFYTNNPGGDILRVIQVLEKVGEIKEVIIREPTLEDVFLKFTGRGLGE